MAISPSVDRWRAKADAVVTAWRTRLGYTPSLSAVVGVLCVAEHETRCGDSWPGEYNWGACTLGPLNQLELEAVKLAGLKPVTVPYSAALAVAAEAERVIRGIGSMGPVGFKMGVMVPHANVHCDSKPSPTGKGQVPYFTWFAGFNDDAGGAEYLISMLCGTNGKRAARYTLEDGMGVRLLAGDMYDAGYYTGFYLREKTYDTPAGPLLGRTINIQRYGDKLATIEPRVRAALGAQSQMTLKRGDRGETVREWQDVIGTVPDGIFGYVTMLATRLWQKLNGLKADGIVGPLTWKKAGFKPTPAWKPNESTVIRQLGTQ